MEIGEVILIENFTSVDFFGVHIKPVLDNFTTVSELVAEFYGDFTVDIEKDEIICVFADYEQAYLFKLSAELL